MFDDEAAVVRFECRCGTEFVADNNPHSVGIQPSQASSALRGAWERPKTGFSSAMRCMSARSEPEISGNVGQLGVVRPDAPRGTWEEQIVSGRNTAARLPAQMPPPGGRRALGGLPGGRSCPHAAGGRTCSMRRICSSRVVCSGTCMSAGKYRNDPAGHPDLDQKVHIHGRKVNWLGGG